MRSERSAEAGLAGRSYSRVWKRGGVYILIRSPGSCKKGLQWGREVEQPRFPEMAAKDRVILAPWEAPGMPANAFCCPSLPQIGEVG